MLKRIPSKPTNYSWKDKYDEAAEKIFTPSKLETEFGNKNTIHENSEIRPCAKVEKWENQLRKPLQNFNYKLRMNSYDQRVKTSSSKK